MFTEFMLLTSLALPLSPLPASDRHAEMIDRAVAADFRAAVEPIEVAQYAPPSGGPSPMAPRGAGPEGPGMQHGPMSLRGLGLTEAQQDAIFNLHHAQAPQMREQMKALGKARQALHEAARADTFDEPRAAVLAADLAKIAAAIELMRVRTEAAVWKLLTPEQRQQAARFQSAMPRGPMGGMDAPRPPR